MSRKRRKQQNMLELKTTQEVDGVKIHSTEGVPEDVAQAIAHLVFGKPLDPSIKVEKIEEEED